MSPVARESNNGTSNGAVNFINPPELKHTNGRFDYGGGGSLSRNGDRQNLDRSPTGKKRGWWRRAKAEQPGDRGGSGAATNPLSESLQEFWHAMHTALKDASALEVNTLVVGEITGRKFVAEDAYVEIMDDLAFHTEAGLRQKREALTRLSNDLKQRSRYIDHDDQPAVDELQRDIAVYNRELKKFTIAEKQYNHTVETLESRREELLKRASNLHRHSHTETERYKQDLAAYKHDEEEFYRLQRCYERIAEQMTELDVQMRGVGDRAKPVFSYAQVRRLRKIWELRAAMLNHDKIYAQTVIQIDGDVINRYDQSLFDHVAQEGDRHTHQFEPPRLTEAARQNLFEIHNRGVASGEAQWQSLIKFVVDLIQNFQPGDRG
jgi:hypothetical protein